MTQNQDKNIASKINSALSGGDVLFIVPPFSRSCLGAMLDPHLLQSISIDSGLGAEVLYLNVLLASMIGIDQFEKTGNAPRSWMVGERLFARAAHALPRLGVPQEERFALGENKKKRPSPAPHPVDPQFDPLPWLDLEETCFSFADQVAPVVAAKGYKIIWLNIGWEQINCALALIDRIKSAAPDTLFMIGGLNCEAAMARGIAAMNSNVDYIFEGEIEAAYAQFLKGYTQGKRPDHRILRGDPVKDMDLLPLPDYAAYFHQADLFLGDNRPEKLALAYETSRGCWKGQKQRCAFCGLSCDERIQYRFKSPEKVRFELAVISKKYKNIIVFMTDHTPPSSYYRELFPTLRLPDGFSMRYQLVAALTLKDLINLKKASVNRIQPGIEALTTPLLNAIHKGIKAHQNLALLRNAMSTNIFVYWYLLWGLPGDRPGDYEKTIELIPLLRHLQPPELLAHVRFEKFGLYVERPEDYGITNLQPEKAYAEIFPENADQEKLAFRYTGDYPCGSHDRPDIIQRLEEEIRTWKDSWRAVSLVMVLFWDQYVIHDTRFASQSHKTYSMDCDQAKEVMRHCRYTGSRQQEWALEHKLAVIADAHYVPLVTASPELLLELEA